MLFTSESVAEGHPDKVADQISDAILDAHLKKDPDARVACETIVTRDLVFLAGEITSQTDVEYNNLVRKVLKEIGYDGVNGFSYDTCKIEEHIHEQSPDIALGVNKKIQGAGDQGMMFGFACNETEERMPITIMLAHKLVKRLSDVRKNNELSYLKPDGKSQVTFDYEKRKVTKVVVGAHHSEDISTEDLREDIKEKVIFKIIPETLIDDSIKFHINETGRFVLGGPAADTGLTGRKIIVDTYGGAARHGGGAFSGKDPSKVDRSASYMARHIAKSIVSSDFADKCEIQLAYVIGVPEPVSIDVKTESGDDKNLSSLIRQKFDLTPGGIIDYLDLKRPIYRETACFGHFGRNHFSWEQVKKL